MPGSVQSNGFYFPICPVLLLPILFGTIPDGAHLVTVD